ncbi:MAG: hypothetical protein Q8K02_04330 [Flavobacterium sp.]|nr:hypothetical protein [Flavobacterium sp.]
MDSKDEDESVSWSQGRIIGYENEFGIFQSNDDEVLFHIPRELLSEKNIELKEDIILFIGAYKDTEEYYVHGIVKTNTI